MEDRAKNFVDAFNNSNAEYSAIAALEKDLQEENKAIELYTQHINKISILEIKNRLIEIRDDEITHRKQLEDLLIKYGYRR